MSDGGREHKPTNQGPLSNQQQADPSYVPNAGGRQADLEFARWRISNYFRAADLEKTRRHAANRQDQNANGDAQHEPPKHDPEVVKQKAGQQLASLLNGEVAADPKAVKQALDTVHANFQGEGLKSLEVRQVPGKPGAFEVLATASPKERVHQFYVSDLQLSFPRTAVLAKLNSVSLGRFTNVTTRTVDGKVSQHAERGLIQEMRSRWPVFVQDCKLKQDKSAPFEVTLTRTPCDADGHQCGQLLQGFVDEKKNERYPLDLSLRMMSAYKAPGGGNAKSVLAGLRAAGAQLSAVTIKQLLEEEAIQGGKVADEVITAVDGGTVVDKDGKAKTLTGSAAELKAMLDQIEHVKAGQ